MQIAFGVVQSGRQTTQPLATTRGFRHLLCRTGQTPRQLINSVKCASDAGDLKPLGEGVNKIVYPLPNTFDGFCLAIPKDNEELGLSFNTECQKPFRFSPIGNLPGRHFGFPVATMGAIQFLRRVAPVEHPYDGARKSLEGHFYTLTRLVSGVGHDRARYLLNQAIENPQVPLPQVHRIKTLTHVTPEQLKRAAEAQQKFEWLHVEALSRVASVPAKAFKQFGQAVSRVRRKGFVPDFVHTGNWGLVDGRQALSLVDFTQPQCPQGFARLSEQFRNEAKSVLSVLLGQNPGVQEQLSDLVLSPEGQAAYRHYRSEVARKLATLN